jgi:hypothetical protein
MDRKMWYIPTMEYYYPAIEKNEIKFLAGKWMKAEIVMLSEVSQAQKEKGHMFSVICGS